MMALKWASTIAVGLKALLGIILHYLKTIFGRVEVLVHELPEEEDLQGDLHGVQGGSLHGEVSETENLQAEDGQLNGAESEDYEDEEEEDLDPDEIVLLNELSWLHEISQAE